jgi:hypothetical protein
MERDVFELLRQLSRARFVVHSYRISNDGPEVVAMVLNRGDCADVLILHHELCAYSYRTPTGDGRDVLDPEEVLWDCAAKVERAARALLELPEPGKDAAPTVLYRPAPAHKALVLPAERRGANLTIRRGS